MNKTSGGLRPRSRNGEIDTPSIESASRPLGLLSREDLQDLTEYKRSADQRRWLAAAGIPYRTGARGTPKVLWADLQHCQSSQGGAPDWRNLPKAP